MGVRIATYNLHGCVGADRRRNVERVAAVLDELGADALLLEEVGDPLGRGPAIDQAHFLAAATGADYAVGYTLPSGPWGYGNVILVRGQIVETERFDLSVAGREPRGCLRAIVRLAGGRSVALVAVHLGLASGERRRQIDRLLGPGGPVHGAPAPLILGGDFNDWPPGPTSRLLGRALLDAAWPSLDFRATFPARFPMFRLDRLYSTSALAVARYHVHRSPLARVASDHLPVTADYVLPDE